MIQVNIQQHCRIIQKFTIVFNVNAVRKLNIHYSVKAVVHDKCIYICVMYYSRTKIFIYMRIHCLQNYYNQNRLLF